MFEFAMQAYPLSLPGLHTAIRAHTSPSGAALPTASASDTASAASASEGGGVERAAQLGIRVTNAGAGVEAVEQQ